MCRFKLTLCRIFTIKPNQELIHETPNNQRHAPHPNIAPHKSSSIYLKASFHRRTDTFGCKDSDDADCDIDDEPEAIGEAVGGD